MTNKEAIKNLEIQKSIQKSYAEAYDDDRTKEVEALSMAITALEKQIPKKIIFLEYVYVKDETKKFYASMCPLCGVGIYGFQKYCKECGQALDWSNDA